MSAGSKREVGTYGDCTVGYKILIYTVSCVFRHLMCRVLMSMLKQTISSHRSTISTHPVYSAVCHGVRRTYNVHSNHLLF